MAIPSNGIGLLFVGNNDVPNMSCTGVSLVQRLADERE